MKNRQFMDIIRKFFFSLDEDKKRKAIRACFQNNEFENEITLSQKDVDVINFIAKKRDSKFNSVYNEGENLDIYFDGAEITFRVAGDVEAAGGGEGDDYIADFEYTIMTKNLHVSVDWEH